MCKLVKNPVVTLLLAAVLVVGCTATLKGSIALVVSLLITLVLSAVVLSGLNKLLTKDIRLLAIIIVMVTSSTVACLLVNSFLPAGYKLVSTYLAVLAVDLAVFVNDSPALKNSSINSPSLNQDDKTPLISSNSNFFESKQSTPSFHLDQFCPSKQSSQKTLFSQQEECNDFCTFFYNYKSKLNVSNKTSNKSTSVRTSRERFKSRKESTSSKIIPIRREKSKCKTCSAFGLRSKTNEVNISQAAKSDELNISLIKYEGDDNKQDEQNPNSSDSLNNESGDTNTFFGKEKTKKSLFSLHSTPFEVLKNEDTELDDELEKDHIFGSKSKKKKDWLNELDWDVDTMECYDISENDDDEEED